jgi:hypothetical protein
MLALGAYASVDPPAIVAVTVTVRPHRVDRARVADLVDLIPTGHADRESVRGDSGRNWERVTTFRRPRR